MKLTPRLTSRVFSRPESGIIGTLMNSEDRKYKLPPRLKKQSEFRRISRRGKRFRSEFLRLDVLAHESGATVKGRVGFTIPDKSINSSVKRNRVRRMLKESVRHWWEQIVPGIDIVFFVIRKPDYDHAHFVELVMLELFLNSGILTEDGRKTARSRIKDIESFLVQKKSKVE